ncbi:RNA-binding S4 domain protein [Aminomonas paucivorans DSM 12260]|uniref:RQC P-site tRNA stabilizing factor n=1 Tax=Aminomonas paucivorans DSM 12260 TaxID=584708 RepID=E3CUY9_9BACT|nr:RNA-binding S4 domain-containing protein [Aminomonas paucivorans]EFQ24115.1 RNA-binding S4 domain protein [Aminomonas paucivorans DSM 12260]
MRLDRFLKLARIVKRRTVAQEMVDIGAVRVNGRGAKPSAAVKAGDLLEVAFPNRVLALRVLTEDEGSLKRGQPCFEVVEERRVDREEKPW